MSFITLTEAITELAFGERRCSADVNRSNIAELEAWSAQSRELSISAHLAAAAEGRDLDFYRTSNPLVVTEHPAAVIALFAACAEQEQRRADAERAFSSSSRRLLKAAASGCLSLFGRFDGKGESKAIPPHELHQLACFPDIGLDTLAVRETWQTWSSVIVDEATFGPWLIGERQHLVTRDQTEKAIDALRELLAAAPRLTAKAATALLKEKHDIDIGEEAIKRDLLPEARRRSGLEPRGPGRPPKSGLGNRENK